MNQEQRSSRPPAAAWAPRRRDGLITLQLVWREAEPLFHSRNPFPVGGVVEDPATGAAAAALGGYLRDAGLLAAPATISIRQGETMGLARRMHKSRSRVVAEGLGESVARHDPDMVTSTLDRNRDAFAAAAARRRLE